MNHKLIIAGANGYIGQRIQKNLNKDVKLLLLSTVPDKKYTFFNLLQTEKFNFNIVNKYDTVVVLAGISSPDECNAKYQHAFNINIIGTIEFINNCIKRGARILYFSSDAIYGLSKKRNSESIFPTNPLGEYGNMKLLIEKYFKNEKNFKSFRLSYVFSWDDKFMKYLKFCEEKKQPAEIYDPFIRKVVYIDDLIKCIENIHNEWEKFNNQHFNICGPKYLSRVDIASCFVNNVGFIELKIVRPDDNFFKARPQKIHFNTEYSIALLGKEFTPICEAMKHEKKNLKDLNL